MIKPICNHCGKELKAPGGLAFGPPLRIDRADRVRKFHICANCWSSFLSWLSEWKNDPHHYPWKVTK